MATRSQLTRSSLRRSGGGGATGVLSVLGIAPIQVVTRRRRRHRERFSRPRSSPTGTSRAWRVYAVDSTRPDDSGAGFADMAGTSAADYSTACQAAGNVAKKNHRWPGRDFPAHRRWPPGWK